MAHGSLVRSTMDLSGGTTIRLRKFPRPSATIRFDGLSYPKTGADGAHFLGAILWRKNELKD
jgi:hypothetical protein